MSKVRAPLRFGAYGQCSVGGFRKKTYYSIRNVGLVETAIPLSFFLPFLYFSINVFFPIFFQGSKRVHVHVQHNSTQHFFSQLSKSFGSYTSGRPGDYRIRRDLGRADDGGPGLPSAVVDPWPGSWTPRGGGVAAAMAMARMSYNMLWLVRIFYGIIYINHHQPFLKWGYVIYKYL